MDKELVAIFEYLEREKGIQRETVISAIEESLQAAAQNSIAGATNVSVLINPKTGKISVFSERHIVEKVTNPTQEISLEDAKEIDPDSELDQFIDIQVIAKDFGRIAAQKARQIITQKLRSAERDVIYEEYRHRIGELVSGTVKRFFRGVNLVVDLGKIEAIMPMRNYPKTEKYNLGERVLALLLEVRDTENGGAEVILSRSDPQFVYYLMEQEVPEVGEGVIILDKIVREAGYRTKITVRSTDPKVDPVGACVGMRGMRVKNVIRELNNEKIDIVPYAEDPIELLQNALAPIEIRKISISEDENEPVISIVVDEDDYAAVLGKRGMNARLCGKLVGAEIEVQKMNEHKRLMTLERMKLAESENPALNKKFTDIEGVSHLITESLITEGFDTPLALLQASPEELAKLPGISLEMADKILEQIRNIENISFDEKSEN